MFTRIIKKRGGYFWAPILYLKRGNRQIVLVGVSHLALISFYQAVQRILDKLERRGFIVMHEGEDWSKATERGLGPFSAEEMQQIVMLEQEQTYAVSRFGLSFQTQALIPRKTWQFFDPGIQQVFEKLLGTMDLTQVIAAHKIFVQKTHRLLKRQAAHLKERVRRGVDTKSRPTWVGQGRDKPVVEKFLELAETRDVVACWGAQHLPNMARLLQEEGFVVTNRRWLPFFPTKFPR